MQGPSEGWLFLKCTDRPRPNGRACVIMSSCACQGGRAGVLWYSAGMKHGSCWLWLLLISPRTPGLCLPLLDAPLLLLEHILAAARTNPKAQGSTALRRSELYSRCHDPGGSGSARRGPGSARRAWRQASNISWVAEFRYASN